MILFDRPGTGWSDPGPFPRRTATEAEAAAMLEPAVIYYGSSSVPSTCAWYSRLPSSNVASTSALCAGSSQRSIALSSPSV